MAGRPLRRRSRGGGRGRNADVGLRHPRRRRGALRDPPAGAGRLARGLPRPPVRRRGAAARHRDDAPSRAVGRRALRADAREDLGYVRDVVRRADRRAMPRAILWVWAALSVAGFAIIDVAPERAGLYWLVAGVAGFLLSAWIGARRARAIGQESEE